VIAVDSGAVHARAWGWPIHLLIGDLDSLPAGETAALMTAKCASPGTPAITAPAAKDETDLELGLAQALAEGSRQIVICAALGGGRADHLLANVLLLARPELVGLDVTIAEGRQTLRMLRGGETMTLAGAPGDLLSLLPVGGDAAGITTAGLAYPLHDETLYLGRARGVSNVFEEPTARISLRGGLLMVVHTKGGEQR
jgi:thiamine pyrophosphokinase